jgi:hypothetical protein
MSVGERGNHRHSRFGVRADRDRTFRMLIDRSCRIELKPTIWKRTHMNQTLRNLMIGAAAGVFALGASAQSTMTPPSSTAPKITTTTNADAAYERAKAACNAQMGAARDDCLRKAKTTHDRGETNKGGGNDAASSGQAGTPSGTAGTTGGAQGGTTGATGAGGATGATGGNAGASSGTSGNAGGTSGNGSGSGTGGTGGGTGK